MCFSVNRIDDLVVIVMDILFSVKKINMKLYTYMIIQNFWTPQEF